MKKGTSNIDRSNTVITIRGLEKSFGDLDVLKNIDMDLYQGENLVVLGRSGTGKSVLIKIISGLLKPDKGQVIVLGKDVARLSTPELRELRQKIGFSFQHSAQIGRASCRERRETSAVG